MLNIKSTTSLLVLLVFSFVSQSSLALTAEERGLEISKELKQRGTGWVDSTADMLMLLSNKHGQKSTREVKIKVLEQLDDGDKSLTVFKKPRDINGTSFLSFSHFSGVDDQWLYLPALKRVKRIASRNKSGPFMSSEFSFEDLSSFEVEKYTYRYLGDSNVNGLDSFMVEQFPIDKNSGYTKRIVWIDKGEYRLQKIEFYDRRSVLLKTLTYVGYQQYLEKFWRPESMLMSNHQNGKSTVLQWNNYAFKTGLSDGDFNRNALKRSR